MQILIAFVIMGLIGTLAVALIAAATLIRLLPVLIVVLVVVGAVRWWERRGDRQAPCRPAPPRPITAPRSAPPPWPTMPRPDAWVLVPVWMAPRGRGPHHPVIDAEVISVDEHHG
jgi:hypothetical protein